jgi:hypothetical protein
LRQFVKVRSRRRLIKKAAEQLAWCVGLMLVALAMALICGTIAVTTVQAVGSRHLN